MGAVAFVFAGQGAQYPGMGRWLYEQNAAAKAVFDAAEAVRPGTLAQCFEPGDALKSTANVQPCVYTVALAAARALTANGVKPQAVAGFSLGECAALAFADVFAPDDGFRFVMQRADAMEAAAHANPGRMAAILKLTDEQAEALCRETGAHPVNYNAPGQLVAAGTQEQITALGALVTQHGGRMMPLNVSGAFHSPHMDAASKKVAGLLTGYKLNTPNLPVYANETAAPYAHDIALQLARQVNHLVRWADTVRRMAQDGITHFIEVGPGATLTNLIKRTLPEATALSADSLEGFDAACAQYGEGAAHA